MPKAVDWFLDLFRVKPPAPPSLEGLRELSPADFQTRREVYPNTPITGWDAVTIQTTIDQQDIGNFQLPELFYHALRREALIAAALDMLRQTTQIFPFELRCPKEAPDELHYFTQALARDWQNVLPDDVKGDIIERTNVFGFCVCRIQWVWTHGQREPRLIPWTHSSLSWRPDLGSAANPVYQGMSENGLELISNDGREWVVFSLGGTRPWLRGLIRPLAYIYFGIITGQDRWLNFNDKFAEPMKVRKVPRLMRESVEVGNAYAKETLMRGGDMVLCPQDEKGYGYDFRYEQVDAQGYKTLNDQLLRFDERAAIVILGHNLLQSVKGGSLAAMRGALELLRTKGIANCKILQTGMETVSPVWARANFGTNPDDFPELGGQLPETVSWSLVYDLTDPLDKQAAGVRSAQFAQGFGTFTNALKAAPPEAAEKITDFWQQVDLIEVANRCGIPMLQGEDSYTESGDEETAELAAEAFVQPPAYMQAAARRSLEWVRKHQRGGTEFGRTMAKRIIRGHVTIDDCRRMAEYFAKHESHVGKKDWGNLTRPSTARIAWGLCGDNGDGCGRAWAEREAKRVTMLTAPAPLPVNLQTLPAIARRAIRRAQEEQAS